ncbi:hypothetical protein OIK40_13420 [Erythrobacter sp. sf7]|uniref:Surface-adhesin protein E-like domain-containing protein n=1 Tax=Erythrobacter fulvus TaxID=2987523 RepID=A0ABT5JSR4_9SPHN|nr:surface-adhesin E family protein [Erythrobacter fulvus]MDC8755644.1 hypothetical protein [Erythrobacter fulvus]
MTNALGMLANRMRKFALGAILISGTIASSAIAADWVYVGTSASDTVFTVDRESIRTLPNGHKRAWIQTILLAPDDDGDDRYEIYLEFDCHELRRRNLQASYFKGDNLTRSINTSSEWTFVRPDSVGETILTAFASKRTKTDAVRLAFGHCKRRTRVEECPLAIAQVVWLMQSRSTTLPFEGIGPHRPNAFGASPGPSIYTRVDSILKKI